MAIGNLFCKGMAQNIVRKFTSNVCPNNSLAKLSMIIRTFHRMSFTKTTYRGLVTQNSLKGPVEYLRRSGYMRKFMHTEGNSSRKMDSNLKKTNSSSEMGRLFRLASPECTRIAGNLF